MNFFKKNRNLSLLIILIFSLILTYIFEERKSRNQEIVLAKKMSILNVDDLGELKNFSGIKLNVDKRGEKYFAKENNLLLSTKKLEEFLVILSGLKIKKILAPAETANIARSFYIPNEDLKLVFTFEKGNLSFSLGKKLDYDQSFYMEVIKGNEKRIMIVADESVDPNVYQNETEYKKSEFKYQRLQMLFYLTNVFFYETKLFVGFPYTESRINFKKIDIATFRNKKFSLDFEKSVTIPPVQNGINYFDDNWVSFHRVLTNVEAKTIYYPYDKAKLSEPLSILDVEDRDGKKYSLEVYKKFGSLPGYFLKNSFNDVLYELRSEDAKYFFVNIQDFWSKKIYPSEKEYTFQLQFPKESQNTYNVSVKDKEIFDAKVTNGKLNLVELKKLIDFLKMESDHISEITEKPSDLVGKMILKLYFANRNLGVILEENDLLLVDLDHKLALHYYVGSTVPFSLRMKDYFEK